MLASECAQAFNYTDSSTMFNENSTLRRVIPNNFDTEYLRSEGVIKDDCGHSTVDLVQARSILLNYGHGNPVSL